MSICCALPYGKNPIPGLYLLLSSLREAIPDFHFLFSDLSEADIQIVPAMNPRLVKCFFGFFFQAIDQLLKALTKDTTFKIQG